MLIKDTDELFHGIDSSMLFSGGDLYHFVLFSMLLCLELRLNLVVMRLHLSISRIVLAGLPGSGKTVLFYQLQDGSSHQGTVTSMDLNESTFVLHSETTKTGKVKPVNLVDVHGHSRLRPKLDEYLPQTGGHIFVVDALEF